MPNHSIVCFGEVLWDLLPSGKIAGGAPMNVAYHALTLGLDVQMISRIGADNLGREMMAFFQGKGIPTGCVQVDPTFPTGLVNVSLDAKGSPSYEIVQPVAWDFIGFEEEAKTAVESADAMVFGSLACRTNASKDTLLKLLDHATLRIFDVNLRQPFFSKELIDELLSHADMVKVNDEELEILCHWIGTPANEPDAMALLKNRFKLKAVILTRGARGAALLNDAGYCSHDGIKVQVHDTIGSGDAFLGAFLSEMLSGASAMDSLAFGCAVGAFVATQHGATPSYEPHQITLSRTGQTLNS